MEHIHTAPISFQYFLRRSFGYWTGPQRLMAYFLTTGFLLSLILNLAVALFINRWSKGFFDALQAHDSAEIMENIKSLILLTIGTALAAISTVQFRMRLQLSWRLWMTSTLVENWTKSRMTRDHLMEHMIDNPEARIADDGRVSIELLVEMVGGIFYSFLTSISFIIVLSKIGGYFDVFGFRIYGYLVYAVILYAGMTSSGIMYLCLPLAKKVEEKAEAEGYFRYFLTRGVHKIEQVNIKEFVGQSEIEKLFLLLFSKCRNVIHGQTKIISFAATNNLIAPIIPVFLCAPKYLSGEMSLGDIMQIAAAFIQVQSSLNWLSDNAFSIANWSASARRVASLDAIFSSVNCHRNDIDSN